MITNIGQVIAASQQGQEYIDPEEVERLEDAIELLWNEVAILVSPEQKQEILNKLVDLIASKTGKAPETLHKQYGDT